MNTEDFYKLSRQERAILVAEDVIAQIESNKYSPYTGVYVTINDNTRTGDIKDSFDTIEECKVCALGATIMSATHLGNKLTFYDISMGGKDCAKINDGKTPALDTLLTSIFTPHQLLLIETAFEGYSYNLSDYFDYSQMSNGTRYAHRFNISLTKEECIKCNDYYKRYTNEGRLIAIMQNIIANEGEFTI